MLVEDGDRTIGMDGHVKTYLSLGMVLGIAAIAVNSAGEPTWSARERDVGPPGLALWPTPRKRMVMRVSLPTKKPAAPTGSGSRGFV